MAIDVLGGTRFLGRRIELELAAAARDVHAWCTGRPWIPALAPEREAALIQAAGATTAPRIR